MDNSITFKYKTFLLHTFEQSQKHFNTIILQKNIHTDRQRLPHNQWKALFVSEVLTWQIQYISNNDINIKPNQWQCAKTLITSHTIITNKYNIDTDSAWNVVLQWSYSTYKHFDFTHQYLMKKEINGIKAKLNMGRWEGNIKRNFMKALHESKVLASCWLKIF